MTTIRTTALLASAILLGSPLAYANPSTKDQIVVTAKGTQSLADVLPTSHVLTSADVEAAQAFDLPDLLNQVSGISVTPTGGRGSVTGTFLRGTSISQNIVLVDGVRVGSATLGAATLNAYPVEAIERVEVVKGPLSGIYGADAVGGVIQVFTRTGGEGRGSATLTLGDDGLAEYGIGLNAGNDLHSLHVSANYEERDGIDHTSITSGGNDDDDSYEESAFSISGKTQLSDNTRAQLSVLYSDIESEFDNTFGADTGFVTLTKTLSAALSINTRINDAIDWNTTLGTNEDESVTEVFFSDLTTNRDSLSTELAFLLNDSTQLTVGADYYQEDIEPAGDFPVSDRDNTGVFALLQLGSGPFNLLANVRYDDNSTYGDETNGSLALNYDFSDRLRAVLSYGTAFSAPSFNFLYFPFFGNPDLLPEESESYELSLLGRHGGLSWRASAYRTDVENLFSFDPATFLAANIGAAELSGLELELGTRVQEWDLSARVDLLSAKDADSGTKLDDRAETTLRLSAARQFERLNLALDLLIEDGRHDNFGTELSGYGLIDVRGSYVINDQLILSASIDNLTDKDYTVNLIGPSERYNTLGRQSKISLRYNF
ncbi:MAG: TonB-dependent receptor [Gammaproteobacteria bacterium]|nr:TonB-dependent receptor [Gammaproteobacteria bacterium]